MSVTIAMDATTEQAYYYVTEIFRRNPYVSNAVITRAILF